MAGRQVKEDKSDVNNNMICAIRKGKLKRVNELIDLFGLSHEQEWLEGYTLICEALRYKDLEVAKALIIKGSRVDIENLENYKNYNGDTPLHLAARKNYIEIGKMILDKGANIYAKDVMGRTPLYFAIEFNNTKFVDLLLKYGFDINVKVKNYICAICVAADKGSLKIVERLWNNGIDINCKCVDDFGLDYAPLHRAVRSGNKSLVMLLLNKGANVDIKAENGMTPLHIIARTEYVGIAEDLLNHGASFNTLARVHCGASFKSLPLEDEYMPVHFATIYGNEKVLTLLLNRGADVNTCTKSNLTPLHIAVRTGQGTMVELLLQHGANVDNQDVDGKTVLYYAVGASYLQIVENILKCVPDINNKSNRSSLKKAVERCSHPLTHDYTCKIVVALLEYGFTVCPEDVKNFKLIDVVVLCTVETKIFKMIETLLEYGADVNAGYEYGRKALHYTVLNNVNYRCAGNKYIENQGEIANLLLNKGANVNSATKFGETTLQLACQYGYAKVVMVLIEYNANVNSIDNVGTTPLHESSKIGNEQISIMLLNKGANVNARTKDGQTPLHFAMQGVNCDNNMVKLLLKFGGDVDSRDVSGRTPLHISIQQTQNEEQIITLLLHKGADINAKMANGQTPLHIAMQRNCDKVNILLAFGADVDSRDLSGKTALQIASSLDLTKHVNTLLDCEKEIARMKSEKINNTNASFYDILKLVTSSSAMYVTMMNKGIVRVLKSGGYKTEFPLYANMIESIFRIGMQRLELLEQGYKIFYSLFSNLPLLPHLCTENVFSYLSNQDLEILVGASKLKLK